MEWQLAAGVFLAVDMFQFVLPFPCSLSPKWSTLLFGAPFSAAGGLLAAGLMRQHVGNPRFPAWAWVISGLLALLGLPLYLLGHMCS
jgi:hypothetical protein